MKLSSTASNKSFFEISPRARARERALRYNSVITVLYIGGRQLGGIIRQLDRQVGGIIRQLVRQLVRQLGGTLGQTII